MATIDAEPFPLDFDVDSTALLIIDMQRDFVLPGGFGEALGNDTSLLLAAVEPIQRVLERARDIGMFVIHTREGHRPDLTDCPAAKLTRGGKTFIGEDGPMGRILVRGEQGHDIIHQLYPHRGRAGDRQAGQGRFHATDLQQILFDRGIKTLMVCGVTLGGLRPHHGPRGQRPRLRVRGPVRLRGLLLPGVPAGRPGDDQGPGRHLRLGLGFRALPGRHVLATARRRGLSANGFVLSEQKATA